MISARKYNIIVTLVVLLILGSLGFGGYYIYHNYFENKEEKKVEPQKEEKENEQEEKEDELVIESSVNENILHDDYDVTIKIPTIKNPEIEGLNDKINDDLTSYYDDEKKFNIDYTYFENNNIISVVIKVIDNNGIVNYLTYNFDVKERKILDNHYLLEYKEIKESDYHGLLVKIYEAYLEELINKDSEQKKDINRTDSFYLKTIDKDNCRIDLPMFLNQDNHINVIFTEYRDNNTYLLVFNINTLKIVEEIKGF